VERGGTVGGYLPERLAPLLERLGEDRLCAVIDAACADAWYQRQPDRLRPEVIFGAGQLNMLLRRVTVPRESSRPAQVAVLPSHPCGGGWREAPTVAELPVGAWCEARCGCNAVVRWTWDGIDLATQHACPEAR
jgi:hypothetical protein